MATWRLGWWLGQSCCWQRCINVASPIYIRTRTACALDCKTQNTSWMCSPKARCFLVTSSRKVEVFFLCQRCPWPRELTQIIYSQGSSTQYNFLAPKKATNTRKTTSSSKKMDQMACHIDVLCPCEDTAAGVYPPWMHAECNNAYLHVAGLVPDWALVQVHDYRFWMRFQLSCSQALSSLTAALLADCGSSGTEAWKPYHCKATRQDWMNWISTSKQKAGCIHTAKDMLLQ